ncbi:hypothetical protein [Corynebacterium xerosis]|uniref:Uncharacterized protein n=1 Tax=Corynebacterium xerosis TaxID=1725 RepID=A0A7X9SVB5_9CORY|nr:hypothetical protein [Corynebacterium xerosis]NMF08691.1 hypothetical protein [Corynebacterium xerosis]
MENQNDRDAIIDTFRRAGLELLRPETIHPPTRPRFFILTSEDLEGPAFSHVLHFDAEMIEAHADYAKWVRQWARATGKEDRLSDASSNLNFEAGTATLAYILDGVPRRMEFEQADDWVNPEVAMDILDDFGDVPGRVRLFIDNGQGGTYVWLPEEGIAEFPELFPEAKRS